MILEPMDYDGSLIHQPFAYKYYRKNLPPLGAIVAFRGKMDVKEHLIDLEDSLADDFIYSEDAFNFCWEIPNMNPVGAVAFQRLFSNLVANFLRSNKDLNIHVMGDDIKLLVTENDKALYRKLSVSIVKCENGTAYGHLGINNNAGSKAPYYAGSLMLNDAAGFFFMERVCTLFYDTLNDINLASRKVI